MTKRRLGELLQAEGLITDDQVRAALELQRKEGMFLGEALVKLGFVSEEAIAHTIVQQFSLPFMSANQFNIPVDVLTIYPERMYYEYQFIAVDKMGKVLLIVGAGLMNHDVLDELERLSGCKVCQYVSTWKDIKSALDKYAKDLRKESELSSLGSMLLDEEPAGRGPAPAAAATAKPASTVAPSAAPRPASTTASPSFLKPAAATSTVPAAGAAPKPASVAFKPAATAAPGVAAKGPPTQSVPKPGMTSSAGSGRLSAMVAQGKSGNTATPNAAAPAEPPKDNPPPKSGLLGLFKKS